TLRLAGYHRPEGVHGLDFFERKSDLCLTGVLARKWTPMRSIGRYMFRTTMGAFLITLVTLTVVMWFTQAIREFDLITTQRQTMFVFIGITGLLIPLLVM